MTTSSCDTKNPTQIEQLFHWNQNPEDKTVSCVDKNNEKRLRSSNPCNIVEFFVLLLKDYFSNTDNIVDDDLRSLIQTKSVTISALSNFDTDKAGEKPCVYVEYSGKKSQEDFAKQNCFDYNLTDGSHTYYTRWQLGFTLYVMGNTLNETVKLAEEVCMVCHDYQEPIRNTMGWLRFQVAEVQKPQCVEGSDSFVSAVSILVVSHYSWKLYDISPRLKRVTFSLKNIASSLDLDQDNN